MVTKTRDEPAAYRALLNATDGIVRQVVEHHRPHFVSGTLFDCRGCDTRDEAAWPCSTTELIAEQASVSLREDDHIIDVEQTKPQMYVIDMSTGQVTGGPQAGTVQHWDRETFELDVHEYMPDACDRCKELRALGYESAT